MHQCCFSECATVRQIQPAHMVHLDAEGAETRTLRLQKAHQNFPHYWATCRDSSDALQPSNARLRLKRPTLCALRANLIK